MNQKFLQILSGIILLYLSVVLFGLPLGMLAEGPTDLFAVFTITLSSVPGIVLIVTAYRQLFRQRRGLIFISSLVFIMTLGIVLSYLYLMKDEYSALQDQIGKQLSSEDSELFLPTLNLKSMIQTAVFSTLLLIIPIYTNLRKIPKN